MLHLSLHTPMSMPLDMATLIRLTDPLEVVLKSARHPHEVVDTHQVHDLAGHGIRVGGREEHWHR